MAEEIELGDRVKDRITELEGIVTAKIEYIFGCQQFRVTPIAEGKPSKSDWIDTPQLMVLEKKAFDKDKLEEAADYERAGGGGGGGERDHPDDPDEEEDEEVKDES